MLLLIPNASLLLGSYITTREWQFWPNPYGEKWESLRSLFIRRFLVKISQNLPCRLWHGTQPAPHTSANGLFGLGLSKYYVLAVSVSNFSPHNAFLLSILITFPVRLILRGVLVVPFDVAGEQNHYHYHYCYHYHHLSCTLLHCWWALSLLTLLSAYHHNSHSITILVVPFDVVGQQSHYHYHYHCHSITILVVPFDVAGKHSHYHYHCHSFTISVVPFDVAGEHYHYHYHCHSITISVVPFDVAG